MLLVFSRANARIYYVVYPTAESQPTAAQIKAGQRSSGSAAVAAGNEPAYTTSTEQVFGVAASGLTPDTGYKVSLVWSDGNVDSNVVTSSTFTTLPFGAIYAAIGWAEVAYNDGTVRATLVGQALTASTGGLGALPTNPIRVSIDWAEVAYESYSAIVYVTGQSLYATVRPLGVTTLSPSVATPTGVSATAATGSLSVTVSRRTGKWRAVNDDQSGPWGNTPSGQSSNWSPVRANNPLNWSQGNNENDP